MSGEFRNGNGIGHKHIEYTATISFGNILTIMGGAGVVAVMIFAAGSWVSTIQDQLRDVQWQLNYLECGLYASGAMQTTIATNCAAGVAAKGKPR